VPTLSLLGTGWLGFPLGKALQATGYTVHATTTQEAKLPLLAKEGFIPHLVEVGRDTPSPDGIGEEIWNSDTLIVTLPFRRNFIDPWIYVTQMHEIVEKLLPHQRLLMTSSTSYYPDCDHIVDEELAFSPISPRLKALTAAEAVIMSHRGPATVLRLGGLYGPDRAIRNFAKKGIEKRDLNSRVNLIHRDDILAIMTRMICDGIGWGSIFNAVSDEHPNRGELYTQIPAEKNTLKKGKVVSNTKLKMALNYQFCYPNPLTSIEDTSP
jgi:nucleoside-diphosphate-sugar epimerase